MASPANNNNNNQAASVSRAGVVDAAIATKVSEIHAQPYAKYVITEDAIARNFGYRIVRHQVATGRNSIIFKAEAPKFQDLYCIVKAYKLGKDKIKTTLKEETCQIMRYVGNKCAQLMATYDIFYTNEKIYIMSDWSARGDVLNAIKTRTVKLTETMLRQWTLDMLSAVQFLHQNAICHRNVAPSALMLAADNHVKLTGLSDAAIYVKPDGSLIKQKWSRFSRTVNWNQPPEVAKNKLYDPRRADVWSTGATVYWFITRTYPIDYKSSSRMTRQLEHRMQYMRKVSSKCMAFVKKMLVFQPNERPTIAQALEFSWLSGGGTFAATSAARETSTGGAGPGAGAGAGFGGPSAEPPGAAHGTSPSPPAGAEPTLMPDRIEAPGEASGPEEAHAGSASADEPSGSQKPQAEEEQQPTS